MISGARTRPCLPGSSLAREYLACEIHRMVDKVNLAEKNAQGLEVLGRVNDVNILCFNGKGDITKWHKHDDAEDCYVVLSGEMTVHLRDRTIVLGPGEMFVVPRHTEHRQTADADVKFLLFSAGRGG